ncbi:MAG: hypothetical protein ACLFUE_05115 [Desulfobacteraceae bacterium]
MSSSRDTQSNTEGDVVLIYYQEEPSVYARIEMIEPDIKKDWYQVTFLMLTLPPQEVTWILREEYFNGEPFTMGGQPLRIEAVPRSVSVEDEDKASGAPSEGENSSSKSAKVVPLRKKTT